MHRIAFALIEMAENVQKPEPKIVADWPDNSRSSRNSITALKASVGLGEP